MAPARLADHEEYPDEDSIVVLHNAKWADYERIMRIRGDKSAPRIAFLEGELEIMSPAKTHESIKSRIARLVEAWCLEKGINFEPVGSWTIKERRKDRGAEPDECYVFGDLEKAKRPDLAIEVVWTSGGLNKLDIYRKLGVREVWYWRQGAITVHRLWGERYREHPESKELPGIDLKALARHLELPTTKGIHAWRAFITR